ncbi:MAG: hypothetical protein MZU79_01110 [Anaerotruncus sp.]|nr:hypothetical protein [Anaerotruncus sp.]
MKWISAGEVHPQGGPDGRNGGWRRSDHSRGPASQPLCSSQVPAHREAENRRTARGKNQEGSREKMKCSGSSRNGDPTQQMDASSRTC